MIQGDNQNV